MLIEKFDKWREMITGERRRRISRPRTLLVFGSVLIILPFINYWIIADRLNIHVKLVAVIFSQLPGYTIFFLLFPFLVGTSLLLIKKWSWWLFLFYSILFVAYNILTLIRNPDIYNLGAFINTVIFISAIIYFSRKDVSAPYFRMYPRGWRLQKRKPVNIPIRIGEYQEKCKDISLAGFFIPWQNCPLEPGQGITAVVGNKPDSRSLDGGVVRVDENGAGVAFRSLSAEDFTYLEKLVGKDLLLRLSEKAGQILRI